MPIIRLGDTADLPHLGGLVQRAAPALTHMHGDWAHRLGSGLTFDEPTCVVAEENGSVVGCTWADPAFKVDYNMPLPWWMFNVVAVEPLFQNDGIGTQLVRETFDIAARNPDVARLVGQCEDGLGGWYEQLGFTRLSQDESMDTGLLLENNRVTLNPEKGSCWFFVDF